MRIVFLSLVYFLYCVAGLSANCETLFLQIETHKNDAVSQQPALDTMGSSRSCQVFTCQMPSDNTRPMDDKCEVADTQTGPKCVEWTKIQSVQLCLDKCKANTDCGSFSWDASSKRCKLYPPKLARIRVRTPNFPCCKKLCGFCRSAPTKIVDDAVAMMPVGEIPTKFKTNYVDLTQFVGNNAGPSAFVSQAGKNARDTAVESVKTGIGGTLAFSFASGAISILDSFFSPPQPNYLLTLAEEMTAAFNDLQKELVAQFAHMKTYIDLQVRNDIQDDYESAKKEFVSIRTHKISYAMKQGLFINILSKLNDVHKKLSRVSTEIRPYFYADVIQAAHLDISAHTERLQLYLNETAENDPETFRDYAGQFLEDALNIGIKWLKMATLYGDGLAEARADFVVEADPTGTNGDCSSSYNEYQWTRTKRYLDQFRNFSSVVDCGYKGMRWSSSWIDLTEASYDDKVYEQVRKRYIANLKTQVNSYVSDAYGSLFKLVLTLFTQMKAGVELAKEKYGHAVAQSLHDLLYQDLYSAEGIAKPKNEVTVDNYTWWFETTKPAQPTGPCESWCGGNPDPWTRKCTFKKCLGCSACVSGAPETTKPAQPTGPCESWCGGNPNPWTMKCTFKKCLGCSACVSGATMASRRNASFSDMAAEDGSSEGSSEGAAGDGSGINNAFKACFPFVVFAVLVLQLLF